MKTKVACFHKMGNTMGTKWAVFMENQRFIQNVQELSNNEFTRGVPEARVFKDHENMPGFLTTNHVLDDLPDENQLSLF